MARANSGKSDRLTRIVFTDLDGTLLDHESYRWDPAVPAMRELERLGWPLILCSSKTAAEMMPLQQALRTGAPFIVENGGGIYLPRGYFEAHPADLKPRGSFLLLPLGKPIADLTEALRRLGELMDEQLVSWMDLSADEIARETGLSLEASKRSQKREFDIPFRLRKASQDAERKLESEGQAEMSLRGLRLTRGGRYFHLTGDCDKGDAVRRLLDLYRKNGWRRFQSIGLGDSLNDLGLLQAVDIPVQIPNPASAGSLHGRIPGLLQAPAPGPAGWNRVVLAFTED